MPEFATSGAFGATSPASGEVTSTLLVQVPEDVVTLRREQPALARAWRLALREALTNALAGGYEITGASRLGWYVLELQ